LMNKENYGTIWKKLLWVSGVIIILFYIIIWYRVLLYNSTEKTIDNSTPDTKVLFEMDGIDDLSDKWTTSMQFSDNPDDIGIFTGATFSARIINNNDFAVNDWTLHMVVKNECYLNGFWCGSVIINQHRNGDIVSGTIDSQVPDNDLSGLDINNYSNSMMIHLLPGDEIVYIPSVDTKEDIVTAHNLVGIGFIFYFQDNFDLSFWNIEYRSNLNPFDLIYTKITIALTVIWIIALIFCLILISLRKKINKQMDTQIKNLSIMSDIYIEAYMVDISNDSAKLIKGSIDNLVVGLEGKKVQESINSTVKNRCLPAYHDELLRFLDLSTVMERMENATSIATEFIGNSIGWCAVRIFKEEGNSNNIVITLQDINEEKKKLKLIEERINLAEHKQHVSGSFLGTVSFALNDISMKVGNDAKEIMSISDQDDVKALADKVMCNTRHMNLIQNTMLDLYNIESQRLELNIHSYCIYEMLDELYHILSNYAEGKSFKFSFEIDDSIPRYLVGDSDRIEQILIIILFSSMLMTRQGFVTFSLFGKQLGNEEELMFSIKDSADGFSKEQIDEIYEFINGASVETFDNASLVYLKIINGILNSMNSELKIVSVVGEGTDFYFSLRQGISNEQHTEE